MGSEKAGSEGGRFGGILGIAAACLNLLAAGSGFSYVLHPDSEGLGLVFGWLLPAAVAATCAGCAGRGFHLRLSGLYLAWTVAGFLLLPLLMIARASFLGAAGFSAATQTVVFGTLGLGFLSAMKQDIRARGEAFPRPGAAIAGFAAGIAALAVTIRFLTNPHPRTAGVLIPQCLPYWSLGFLAAAALSARAYGTLRRSRAGSLLFALPALAAAVLAAIPVYQTPGVVRAAERDFLRAFGDGARSEPDLLSRRLPFSPGTLFLGSDTGRPVPRLDVPYHSETVPDGRSYTFRFDQWSPEGAGPHPVLIRIHGGGWVSGDKGYGNMNNVNRHFASLGYLVFDLQYGLAESGTFRPRAPTPEGMLGPFGIEDMLRHIGTFSSYLAENAGELGADLDRVFVSGASAGGHLALASALTLTSGYARSHPGVGLDPRLTVRGVIPFYPGVGYAAGMGIPSNPELDNLVPLLGPENPPALFYQGSLDGMVDPLRIRDFVREYSASGGGDAVLVEFPSAGHGSDLVFWNPYSQVFLHYMEHFLAIHARR